MYSNFMVPYLAFDFKKKVGTYLTRQDKFDSKLGLR